MLVKLLDRDLVRRYGPKIIKVDDAMGVVLVKHNKAVEVNKDGSKVENKSKMIKEYLDKMIKGAPVDKGSKNEEDDSCIFPNVCFQ